MATRNTRGRVVGWTRHRSAVVACRSWYSKRRRQYEKRRFDRKLVLIVGRQDGLPYFWERGGGVAYDLVSGMWTALSRWGSLQSLTPAAAISPVPAAHPGALAGPARPAAPQPPPGPP